MVCPAEPWPVFSLGKFPWQNFDPLAVTPISAFYLVSEISSTCLPSLATSSNFWPSKSSRQTRWGLCGAYLRLMLMLMVMLLLMSFLKLINRWERCGICGKSTNRGGCSGWGRTWPMIIYLNIANGTSGPGIDCFNQSANLCLLFSNIRKGRYLHCGLVGWFYSYSFSIFLLIHKEIFSFSKYFPPCPSQFLLSSKKNITFSKYLSSLSFSSTKRIFSFSQYLLRIKKRFALFIWFS